MQSNAPLRVIVVDDNKVFTSFLKEHLAAFNITVIAEARNDEEMFTRLRNSSADVVIYDLFLCSRLLAETMKELRQLAPEAKTLLLSYDTSEELIDFCLTNGAAGFCTKVLPDIDTLAEIVQKIAHGEIIVQIPAAA